jgi:diguanylate cyclase (GGDEF)-like protein
VAARYGGDEFTFILPDTDAQTTQALMESIRRTIEESDLLETVLSQGTARSAPASLQKVTTSQGLACYPEHASDTKTLREAADSALYRAKETGRNRIVSAGSGKTQVIR